MDSSAAGGRRRVGVAVAGFGWMGGAEEAAAQVGFATATRDWRDLADAVRSAATLDAMARSAETGAWVKVPIR